MHRLNVEVYLLQWPFSCFVHNVTGTTVCWTSS